MIIFTIQSLVSSFKICYCIMTLNLPEIMLAKRIQLLLWLDPVCEPLQCWPMIIENFLHSLAVLCQRLRKAYYKLFYLCSPIDFNTLQVDQDAFVHLKDSFSVASHQVFKLHDLGLKAL